MHRPRDSRRWVGVFLAVLAAAVLVGFGFINAWLNTYLPHVTNDQSVRPGRAEDATWFVLLLVGSIAMSLSAGFPEGGLRAKGWVGGAVVQGLSGLIAAAGVCLAGALYNIGPADLEENPCRYAGSCWPHDPQLYAWLAPGLVGALAMVVMACLVRWLPWWIRVLTPVVLWVAAVVTLHAIWVPVLLPILTGPPR